MKKDVIIIGSGIAGLFAGIELKDKDVLIITKNSKSDCNTYWAQGGIATALNEDDISAHVSDTLYAGAGVNDKKAVEILSQKSLEVMPDLISLGVPFDKDDNGHLLYTQEAAHSAKRIIRAGGDATGKKIHETLLRKNPHEIMDKSIVVDILIKDNIFYGVSVLRDNEVKNIYANNLIIASGGLGSLYEFNTNARGISGDIHGICLLKKCALQDMHLIQFHPTVFVKSKSNRKLLLTEALRGEGAYIVDEDNYRFLPKYHKDAELAPRDEVSRAIYLYGQKTGKKIFLDLSMFKEEFFKNRFPTIYNSLKAEGLNPPYDKIPISPAFHYAMGGIKTNLDAKVEGIKNIYAVGEVASNRVHGANRLASNSLLEGIVFAKMAAKNIKQENFSTKDMNFADFRQVLKKKNDNLIKTQLRTLMWQKVGIARKISSLKQAKEQISQWLDSDIGWLIKLRLTTAKSIVDSALKHRKSIGAHYIIKE